MVLRHYSPKNHAKIISLFRGGTSFGALANRTGDNGFSQLAGGGGGGGGFGGSSTPESSM